MRVAFFSPLPPARTGIADYSAALLEPLRRLADVETFPSRPARLEPDRFDVALYQTGNNPFHGFVYETALDWPGVAVLHEANLHHLVAELTIKRGDWEGYLEEAAYNGGEAALRHAERVRAGAAGPDYEGLPMLRRLLDQCRAVIVHSRTVLELVRGAGFNGPIARIPHGAWTTRPNPMEWRDRLGVDETAPLIGIFGFLKPYKRIREALLAFRRLARVEPGARMILVGEPHPDLPLDSMIRDLHLSASVRVLGFTPIEDFAGYLSACDIVLNLRYPSVGETSGTLQRALGMGKAVVVSDVGAFSELPDDICLKVPVGGCEEEILFEFLNLLVSRPETARALGRRARQWAEAECSWETVARRYVEFLEAVTSGREWVEEELPQSAPPPPPAPPPDPEVRERILGWSRSPASRDYAAAHLSRLDRTIAIIPPGGPSDRILEMGVYFQITPLLASRLGYGEVRGCYLGQAGTVERRVVGSDSGERFQCEVDHFDAERDSFPYPDASFAAVLCCELIEHLAADPMHMLCEINRVLRPGGHLVLTTPNLASARAIQAILDGFHPGFFPGYIRPPGPGERPEVRHNREYTPREICRLLQDAGFEVTRLETGPFLDVPHPEHAWVMRLLERYQFSTELRGDGIFAVGRRAAAPRLRYPSWLYTG